jgi:hypothetical protein
MTDRCRLAGRPHRATATSRPPNTQYLLTLVDRSAETLTAATPITEDTTEAVKAEAPRRARASTFLGHKSSSSAIAEPSRIEAGIAPVRRRDPLLASAQPASPPDTYASCAPRAEQGCDPTLGRALL